MKFAALMTALAAATYGMALWLPGAPSQAAASSATSAAPPVYYAGCNEARAAGVAPIQIGDPGYRAEMDGDGDGVACEPHRR